MPCFILQKRNVSWAKERHWWLSYWLVIGTPNWTQAHSDPVTWSRCAMHFRQAERWQQHKSSDGAIIWLLVIKRTLLTLRISAITRDLYSTQTVCIDQTSLWWQTGIDLSVDDSMFGYSLLGTTHNDTIEYRPKVKQMVVVACKSRDVPIEATTAVVYIYVRLRKATRHTGNFIFLDRIWDLSSRRRRAKSGYGFIWL